MWYLFIILLVFCQSMTAQVDDPTILGSIPYNNTEWTYNTDIDCVGSFYFFTTYHYDEQTDLRYYSLVKTDMELSEIARVDTIEVNNNIQQIVKIIYANEIKGYALMTGAEYGNDKSSYYILKLDLETLEIEVVDSIQMLSTHTLEFRYFKQLYDSTLVSLGANISIYNYSPYDNVYIELSTTGEIVQYTELDIGRPTDAIGFEYIEESELFFLMPDAGSDDFLVFDKELNLKQRLENDIDFEYDGMPWSGWRIKSRFCDGRENYVHCIGYMSFAREHVVSHIRFPIIGDSIGEFDQLDPLFERDIQFSGEFLIHAVDDDGNVLLVLDDQHSFRNDPIDTTTLYVMKTNYEDYGYTENEWFISYRGSSEFSVWAADVDKNGDFIMVGGYWRQEFYGDTHNFYMKVQSDGTITSTKGPIPEEIMVVYPNPTRGEVHIKEGGKNLIQYVVYDSRGRKVKTAAFQGLRQFNISNLSSGTYFIHFIDREGKTVKRSKVVKY